MAPSAGVPRSAGIANQEHFNEEARGGSGDKRRIDDKMASAWKPSHPGMKARPSNGSDRNRFSLRNYAVLNFDRRPVA